MRLPKPPSLTVYSGSIKAKILCAFLPIFLLGASVAMGADFWEKKVYTEWTDKECAAMLTDSPWAWKYEALKTGSLGNSDAAEGQQYVRYVIQFISALPIRQAKVRQMQLVNKYDSLSPEQKQAFDKQAEPYLSADYSDKIVVNVAYSTNAQRLDMDLARDWQAKTMGVLQNSVFLYAGKGEKARLVDFKVGQGAERSFQFVFPRQAGGAPVLTEKDKSLILEFVYPVLGGIGDGKVFAEFKVKKMMLNGMLLF